MISLRKILTSLFFLHTIVVVVEDRSSSLSKCSCEGEGWWINPWEIVQFGAFIIFCGLTHFVNI